MRNHDAGISDQVTSRLEQQVKAQVFGFRNDGLAIFRGQRRCFVAVGNAEPAAQVEVLEVDARFLQTVDEAFQFLDGVDEGRNLGQLAADVAVDADDIQVGHPWPRVCTAPGSARC